jgi:hypothetical protein
MKFIKGVLLGALVIAPMFGFAQEATNVMYKSSVAFGATFKSGNTDKSLYTMDLKGDRYTPKNDWINSIYGEYGETDKARTEGKIRGQSDYRYKFGGKDFFAGVFGEMLNDAVKEIWFRAKLGPNVGYYFINKDHHKLDASAGINYVYERTATVERNYGEWRLAGNYFIKLSEKSEFYLNAEYSANLEDYEDSLGLLVTGVKSQVKDNFSIYIELRDEYDNHKDLGVEEYNDVTIIAGLAYDFM